MLLVENRGFNRRGEAFIIKWRKARSPSAASIVTGGAKRQYNLTARNISVMVEGELARAIKIIRWRMKNRAARQNS